jgi:hypothetical protein
MEAGVSTTHSVIYVNWSVISSILWISAIGMSMGWVGSGTVGVTGVKVASSAGGVVGNGTLAASLIVSETVSLGGAGRVGLGFLRSSSSGICFFGDRALGSRPFKNAFPFSVGAV